MMSQSLSWDALPTKTFYNEKLQSNWSGHLKMIFDASTYYCTKQDGQCGKGSEQDLTTSGSKWRWYIKTYHM